MMADKARYVLVAVFMLLMVALIGVGLWQQHNARGLRRVTYSYEQEAPANRPPAIANTPSCEFIAYLPSKQLTEWPALRKRAYEAAASVNYSMNPYLKGSPVRLFNDGKAGQYAMPTDTVHVLRTSQAVWKQSNGAFDITIRPMIRLWKTKQKQGQLPSDAEIRAARNQSAWPQIKLSTPNAATKSADTTKLDFGGIAKGFAIDKAFELLKSEGVEHMMISLGSTQRVCGGRPGDNPWRLGITNPFLSRSHRNGQGQWFIRLGLKEGAVSTSGNYERPVIIRGKKYSHIINPTTGQPCDMIPSVTVIAPTGELADAWSTALSVLGPDGLKLLKGTGIEAMLIKGTEDNWSPHMTPGFDAYILERRLDRLGKPNTKKNPQ